MLDEKDFDDWAPTYDESVERTDAAGAYPFAGYERIMDAIFERVTERPGARVLDLGFGTAALTARLHEAGCEVFGQDFSSRMVKTARAKMPGAHLYQGDLANGLVPALNEAGYDVIVATYALHHLDDVRKVTLIRSLLPLLSEGGSVLIGDVAFSTRADLEACQGAAGDTWDPDELYFVLDELRAEFPAATFERMSSCAGLITIPAVVSRGSGDRALAKSDE